jgi:hypothetical protein
MTGISNDYAVFVSQLAVWLLSIMGHQRGKDPNISGSKMVVESNNFLVKVFPKV